MLPRVWAPHFRICRPDASVYIFAVLGMYTHKSSERFSVAYAYLMSC